MGRILGISEKCVRDWRNNEEKIKTILELQQDTTYDDKKVQKSRLPGAGRPGRKVK